VVGVDDVVQPSRTNSSSTRQSASVTVDDAANHYYSQLTYSHSRKRVVVTREIKDRNFLRNVQIGLGFYSPAPRWRAR